MAAIHDEAQYKSVDNVDKQSAKPNFSVLIYPAYLTTEDNSKLRPEVIVNQNTPPTFFAHAVDDQVPVQNSIRLALALKENNIPTELHVYSEGGHGYGLRETDVPVTTWSINCTQWLKVNGWTKRAD